METKPFTTRPVEAKDETAWRELWRDYCDFYEVTVPEDVTATNWQRILDLENPVNALVAVNQTDTPIGFAIYILHAHTWTDKLVCYLEDLYVMPAVRRRGIGHALISHLAEIGRQQNWDRVYWHTNADNAQARLLYDRLAPAGDVVRYMIRL